MPGLRRVGLLHVTYAYRRVLPQRGQRSRASSPGAPRARRGTAGVLGVRRRGLPRLRLEPPGDVLRARHRRDPGPPSQGESVKLLQFAPSPKQMLIGLAGAVVVFGVAIGVAYARTSIPSPIGDRDRADDHDVLQQRRPAGHDRDDEPHRCSALAGAAARSAGGAGGGGPQLLLRAGHLTDRDHAGAVRGREGRRRLAGRLDDHAAIRQERVPEPAAVVHPQVQGDPHRDQAGSVAVEELRALATTSTRSTSVATPTASRPPRRPTSAPASRS